MASNLWFFDVLGIEPTNDKTAIKQAYSRIAHKTNPEDDPDGYAKLHEAYRAALDYASDKVVPYEFIDEIEEPDECEESEKTKFDFSSVRPDNPALALDPEAILEQIAKLKNESKINSFEVLFERSDIELCETAVELFKLYSALAEKEFDWSLWDAFFNEPLIKIIIKEQRFRGFIWDSFPEGNINRMVIQSYIDEYEQEVFDARHLRERRQIEIEKELGPHATWMILAFVIISAAIVLILLLGPLDNIHSYVMSISFSLLEAGAYFMSRFLDVSKNLKRGQKSFKYLNIGLAVTVVFNILSWTYLFFKPLNLYWLSVIALVLCGICSLSYIGVLVYHIAEQIRYRKTSVK